MNSYSLDDSIKFLQTHTHYQLRTTDVITTISGRQICRLPKTSKLLTFLQKEVQDIFWSETVWKSYKQNLSPILKADKATRHKIKKWILKHAFQLGCALSPFVQEKQSRLPLRIQGAWKQFISQFSCLEHSHEANPVKEKIVILTHQFGEKNVTDAILKELYRQGRDAVIVDVDDVLKKGDSFHKFSGLTVLEIHSKVTVQRGRAISKPFWYMSNLVESFIPNNSIYELVKYIQALKPTQILSARWSQNKETALSSRLQIPMKIILCDFCFPKREYGKRYKDATLLQFWMPAGDISHLPKAPRVGQLRVFGYPTSDAMKIATPAELIEIQKKWGVAQDKKVIFMMMGSAGADAERFLKILNQLVKEKVHLPPLEVGIVCGKNEDLKNRVTEIIQTRNLSEFRVFGWVDSPTVSDWYNMAHLYIGKMGGSTTNELMKMGVWALGFGAFKVEKRNLAYLIKLGTAYKLKLNKLTDQILGILNQPKESCPTRHLNFANWKAFPGFLEK